MGLVLAAPCASASAAPAAEPTPQERPAPFVSTPWPVVVQGATASLGFYPATPHAWLGVGTEYPYLTRRHYDLVQSLGIGYLEHPGVMRGPNLDAGLTNRFKTVSGFYVDLNLALGLSWYAFPGKTYTANPDTGAFEQGGNRGFVSFRATPSLAAGFDLQRAAALPMRFFVKYEQLVMVPFWKQEAPLLGQAIIGGGITISTSPRAWRQER